MLENKNYKIKKILKTENYYNKCKCGKTLTMEEWASNKESFCIVVCDCGTIFIANYGEVDYKIKGKDFKILKLTSERETSISVYLEAVNYMMYEFSDDNKDSRQLFPYIIIPNDVDWDFTSITLKEFINFLAKNKSKTIEMIDTNNIEFVSEPETKKLDDFWD